MKWVEWCQSLCSGVLSSYAVALYNMGELVEQVAGAIHGTLSLTPATINYFGETGSYLMEKMLPGFASGVK